jgi:3-hydroxyacyl-CoA dehydrogenase
VPWNRQAGSRPNGARVQNALGQLEADPEAVAALAAVERLDAVDFASAAVVVEVAPERLKLKRAIFAGLDRLVPLTFGMDPVHGLSFLGRGIAHE